MAEEEHQNTDPGTGGNDTTAAGDAGNDTLDTGAQNTKPNDGDVLDSTGDDTAKSSADGDVLSGDDDTGQKDVPDQYTFDAPEGVELNEEAMAEFQSTAKELGLTQDQFQKLVEYDLERSQAAQQQAVDGWNERVDGWKTAARQDKEFGGENYNANVKVALSAVEKFGDSEFKALLKSPSEDNPEGLAVGNHPAMLRFLNRIGKALSDPDFVPSGDAVKDDQNDARLRRLYPSMFKESA